MIKDEIQYQLQEYDDNPLTFERIPEWLSESIELNLIIPMFGTEDYWYLLVETPTGVKDIGPDDWIQWDGKYLYTR